MLPNILNGCFIAFSKQIIDYKNDPSNFSGCSLLFKICRTFFVNQILPVKINRIAPHPSPTPHSSHPHPTISISFSWHGRHQDLIVLGMHTLHIYYIYYTRYTPLPLAVARMHHCTIRHRKLYFRGNLSGVVVVGGPFFFSGGRRKKKHQQFQFHFLSM